MQADYPGAEAHFLPADHFGSPTTNGHGALVIHKTGVVKQAFEHTIVCWDPNYEVSPPGAGKASLMHLLNEPVELAKPWGQTSRPARLESALSHGNVNNSSLVKKEEHHGETSGETLV